MRQADHIVVFGHDGRISEQGFPKDLRNKDSAAKGLLTKHPSRENVIDADDTGSRSKTLTKQATSSGMPKPEERDLKRQTGDLKLYSYYYRSIGWANSLTFLVLATAYTFLGKLPREFDRHLHLDNMLTHFRNLATNLDGARHFIQACNGFQFISLFCPELCLGRRMFCTVSRT